MSKSLFSSSEYVLYRFEYPEVLFQSLRASLSAALQSGPLQVLDLGCGTGLVTESFLRSYSDPVRVHLVDPDAEMLHQAQKRFVENISACSFHVASAEKIPFEDDFFDLILIGSAWHWMDQRSAVSEIERVLKHQGSIFIFEYQFPKAIQYSELNDWIRIRFNLDWKPATQTPRGSLKELTNCFREHPQFSQSDSRTMIQERSHHASDLAGVIVSQSRYQHYEQSFPVEDRAKLRGQLEQSLDEFLKGGVTPFRYSYEGYVFRKRV